MSVPAGATPRPWHAVGGSYGSVVSLDPEAVRLDTERRGEDHVRAYGGVLVGESIEASNRELIVQAVNEYEALLALEQEVRHAFRPDAIPLRFERALAGIDAARSSA